LSLHAAQEKVRTARALKALPQTDEKLKVGELSYSEARALSRIATTENESELLQIAEHATAAQVERLVRNWVCVDEANAKKQETQKEDRRGYHIFFDESGMCVVSAKLRPEEGALLMKAIEVAREKGQSLADALVAVAERSLVASEAKDGARYQAIVHTGPGFDEGTVEGRLGDRVALPAGSIKRVICDAATVEVKHDENGRRHRCRKKDAAHLDQAAPRHQPARRRLRLSGMCEQNSRSSPHRRVERWRRNESR
jgi:hypothetical protein